MHGLAALLLSLPLVALAGRPHAGSLHRKHWEKARGASHVRRGVTYTLEDDYSGQSFFDGWTFFSDADPTGGNVNYLSESDAQNAGLAYVQSDETIVLAVDSYTTLQSGQNRNSVRIQTKKTYNSGLFVADFFSMPHGCSVWPAYWTVGDGNWPDTGEVDIIEGVNLNAGNQITIHTGPTCSLTNTDVATANLDGTTCTSSAGNDAGCAFSQSGNNTFGHGFNLQGGGVYAHLWDSTGVSVWFFARGAIPDDISSGNPDPSSWGAPAAIFPSNDSCDLGQHLTNHQIVIDTTLCGDWAGPAFSSVCPGTCADYVLNPDNFKYAKWMISSIKVYQPSS